MEIEGNADESILGLLKDNLVVFGLCAFIMGLADIFWIPANPKVSSNDLVIFTGKITSYQVLYNGRGSHQFNFRLAGDGRSFQIPWGFVGESSLFERSPWYRLHNYVHVGDELDFEVSKSAFLTAKPGNHPILIFGLKKGPVLCLGSADSIRINNEKGVGFSIFLLVLGGLVLSGRILFLVSLRSV